MSKKRDAPATERRELTEYEKEIAQRIKECRLRLGISQERAAMRVSNAAERPVSRPLFEAWENGRATMDAWLLPSIAKALQTSTAFLLGEEVDPAAYSMSVPPEVVRLFQQEPAEDHQLYEETLQELRQKLHRVRRKQADLALAGG